MPEFSDKSLRILGTVHQDLQIIFMEVVKHYDCTIISGLRTMKEQKDLYAKGRTDDGDIVTYKDGIDRQSNHQSGMAVDAVPYPIDWGDFNRFREFGWYVKGIAKMQHRYGTIEYELKWGGDWRWKDLPHFEL
jgi:LAS superfamily LD-carboxypeptidase LdcB